MKRLIIILALVVLAGAISYVAESHYHISRRVDNLFRRDDYASFDPGAPHCHILISLNTESEIKTFEATLRRFARESKIHECRQKIYRIYSGPPRPTFIGDHVVIWSAVYDSPLTGSIYLELSDQKYPLDDFRRMADSLVRTMRKSFPNLVEKIKNQSENQ